MSSSTRKDRRQEDQTRREDQKHQKHQKHQKRLQAQIEADKRRKEARKKDATAVAKEAWTRGRKLESIGDLDQVLKDHVADIDHPPDFYRCLEAEDKCDIILSCCKAPLPSTNIVATVPISTHMRDQSSTQSEHNEQDPTKQPGSESGSDKSPGLSIDYEDDITAFDIAIWDPGRRSHNSARAHRCKNEESFIRVEIIERCDIRTKAPTIRLTWIRQGSNKTSSTRFRIVPDDVIAYDVVFGKTCDNLDPSASGPPSDSGYCDDEGGEEVEVEEHRVPQNEDEMSGQNNEQEESSDDERSDEEDGDSQCEEEDAESDRASSDSEEVREAKPIKLKRRESAPVKSRNQKESSSERRRHSDQQPNSERELELKIAAKLTALIAKELAKNDDAIRAPTKRDSIEGSSGALDRPRSKKSSTRTSSSKLAVQAKHDPPMLRDDLPASRKKPSGRKRPP